MKNLKNKIIIGIAILIFVVGIIVVAVKGFNVDLEYQDTKKIEANIGKSFEKEDIENIVKEVLGKERFKKLKSMKIHLVLQQKKLQMNNVII